MYQKIIVSGNIGRDGELKYMGDGTPLMNWSVATNRRTKDGKDITTWFRVTQFGQLAQTFHDKNMIVKGRRCLVEGQLIADTETGGPRVYKSNDGSHRASFEIRATHVSVIFDRGEGSDNQGQAQRPMPSADEIPF